MKIKLNNADYINILLIFWTACLFSINSSIIYNGLEKINFYYFFNYFRAYCPIVIFLILIITFVIKQKKKLNLFLISYFIYGFWQIIALLIYSKEYPLDLSRLHIVVSLLTTLLIIYYINWFNQINLNKLLFISISFIILICIFFYSKIFYDLITNVSVDYIYWSPSLIAEDFTLSQTNPRITGLSRMLVLILFFLFYFFTINKKYFLAIPLIIINFLIYGSQSRGSFIGVFILYASYLFFFKEKKLKKLLIIVITIILPIISYESLLKVKNYLNKESQISINLNKESQISINLNKKNRFFYPVPLEKEGINSFNNISSGRIFIWLRALKIINQDRNFIGYGPQADRALLKKDKLNIDPKERYYWDNNVSNGILYSFLSGGIISFVLFLLIYFLIFLQIYKSIFTKKIYNNNLIYVHFSTTTLLFFSLRSLFENSYAVFSIDSLFVCIAYSILYRSNNSKN